MRRKDSNTPSRPKVLVLVDESNVGSSVRSAGRGLDWLKLRDFLAGPGTGRDLIEMVVYAGLPPATPVWQEERDKKNKFVQWLRSNGFMNRPVRSKSDRRKINHSVALFASSVGSKFVRIIGDVAAR